MEQVYKVGSPQEMIDLGKRFAKQLVQGSVVTLKGTLAAGKTTFTKGIALGLGVTEDVTSPTFTIISEYDGNLPLYHMDTYRLGSEEEFLYTGGEELFHQDGVSIVEWPEIIDELLPKRTIRVVFEITDPTTRQVTITGGVAL